jgi:phenylpropionate dioxygenase-like ring-hydroxylating dioxygenase large terminal subunit
VAVNILPNHLFIILAQPVSPRLTRETTFLLTHSDSTDDKDTEQALNDLSTFWDTVNREDIEIVERVNEASAPLPSPAGASAIASRSRCTDSKI